MRWPWSRPERRQSGGGYTDAIVSAIEAEASRKVADASATAAIEAAAGALSRALSCADVEGPGWVRDTVDPVWLAQVGRSLIREGASLSVIEMAGGDVHLVPAAFWNFEGSGVTGAELEQDWECRATTYGPSSSYTRLLSRDRLVFIRWGTSPGTRYRGRGPTSWASLTARLQGETERSLADEAGGPIAQLLPVPQDGGDGEEDTDPLALLKADVAAARGKALLVETTAAGWGEGKVAAPQADWKQQRLGPAPPTALVQLADQAFGRMLAACGCSPALFDDSDGTAKREALRQWHLGTVQPLARILAHELTHQLGAEVHLKFDLYNVDLAGRASAFPEVGCRRDGAERGVDYRRSDGERMSPHPLFIVALRDMIAADVARMEGVKINSDSQGTARVQRKLEARRRKLIELGHALEHPVGSPLIL